MLQNVVYQVLCNALATQLPKRKQVWKPCCILLKEGGYKGVAGLAFLNTWALCFPVALFYFTHAHLSFDDWREEPYCNGNYTDVYATCRLVKQTDPLNMNKKRTYFPLS